MPGYYYIEAVKVFFSELMIKVAYLRINFSPYISFILFHNHLSLVIYVIWFILFIIVIFIVLLHFILLIIPLALAVLAFVV